MLLQYHNHMHLQQYGIKKEEMCFGAAHGMLIKVFNNQQGRKSCGHMKAWKRISGFSSAIQLLHSSTCNLTSLCFYLLPHIKAAVKTFVTICKG